MAGLVKQTPGSVGYVELIYAVQNRMGYADVQNRKGNFIKPSMESTTRAADISLPDDMRVSLTNTDAPEGYPISGFTWILVFKEQSYNGRSEAQTQELSRLLWWMTQVKGGFSKTEEPSDFERKDDYGYKKTGGKCIVHF